MLIALAQQPEQFKDNVFFVIAWYIVWICIFSSKVDGVNLAIILFLNISKDIRPWMFSSITCLVLMLSRM